MSHVAATHETTEGQESPMTITALAPWFGAKRNLAAAIVAEAGEHRTWWELFGGSFAPLLSKPPASMETVNDLHGDLINLARIIQHPALGPQLYRMLRRTLMHEDFFAEADEFIRASEKCGYAAGLADRADLGPANVHQAYRYFIVSWMGRNGTAGTPASHKGTYCVRYTNRGGHACKRWTGAVSSIPAWRRRMANVTVIRRDAFELAERIADEPRAVIYCDPPYLVKGCTYLHDDNAGRPEEVGEHEWFAAVEWSHDQIACRSVTDITSTRLAWHKCLADRLGRFRQSRVIVSYYQHELLGVLYPMWTVRRLRATKAMAHAGQRGNSGRIDAPEVLLINGPSLVEASDAPLLEGCS